MTGSGVLAKCGAAAARLRKIEVLVNPLAGHVGPGAAADADAIIREFGLEPRVRAPAAEDLARELAEAVAAAPDLLIVLAGDGTARAAASLCGAQGPLLAPLAGGTMNMLPHALYGPKPWRAALREMLELGVERPVSGGQANGVGFYVAAILGPPALWAEAREAARLRRPALAWRKAKVAWARAFRNHVTFRLDGARPEHAEALSLICPMVSRAVPDDEPRLEAAALCPGNPAGAMRLGLHALLGQILGDWRQDPAVRVAHPLYGVVRADRGHVHAILDGEPMRLGRRVEFGFIPVAFRALAPPHPAPHAHAASSIVRG